MEVEIEGAERFSDVSEIARGGSVIVSGSFQGTLVIQMSRKSGPWITVRETKRPGKFDNKAAASWRIRVGFLKDYKRGAAHVEIVPRRSTQGSPSPKDA